MLEIVGEGVTSNYAASMHQRQGTHNNAAENAIRPLAVPVTVTAGAIDRPPPSARLAAALLLAACAAAAGAGPVSAAAAPARTSRFTFYGLEPAAAGQARAEAEAALGQALKAEPTPPQRAAATPAIAIASATPSAPAGTGCRYHGADSQPGVRYTVAAGVISRIETRDARYATVSGVHVGDTIERARRVYGKRLTVAAHPYFDKGHMLTVYSPDRHFALVMESNDAGRIITLRGGRWPDVGWLEGCS